jgi:hypothetical protein
VNRRPFTFRINDFAPLLKKWHILNGKETKEAS